MIISEDREWTALDGEDADEVVRLLLEIGERTSTEKRLSVTHRVSFGSRYSSEEFDLLREPLIDALSQQMKGIPREQNTAIEHLELVAGDAVLAKDFATLQAITDIVRILAMGNGEKIGKPDARVAAAHECLCQFVIKNAHLPTKKTLVELIEDHLGETLSKARVSETWEAAGLRDFIED